MSAPIDEKKLAPDAQAVETGTFTENAKLEAGSVSVDSDAELAKLTNARLNNPLVGLSAEKLIAMGAEFAKQHGLDEFSEDFSKGALVAQNPEAFESLPLLDEEDRTALRREFTHRWDQPRELYYLVATCSMAAAVQGMDESVINGANLFFPDAFGIGPNSVGDQATFQYLQGLVLGAPYLCCAVFSCWLTDPLNAWLGRRGTIFLTAAISALACIWSAFTNTWWHLFIARLFLGVGIGPKSSTVPVYAAETAPTNIRGALVMQWQTWTAFGIAIGTVADLIFLQVPDVNGTSGLNWRLMLGSACLPAFFVCSQVYFNPESPRWLISKNRFPEAFQSLCRLRHTKLQAARDLFYINVLLIEEMEAVSGGNRFLEIFTVGRNRRGAIGAGIVMFMQQFCGVNVIAYYSSTIFTQSGFSVIQAFVASFGFGALNFLFAIPAIFTIDTFGRRKLLLTTFPVMAAALLLTGMAFFIQNLQARIGVVALGIYIFIIAYSPGMGPIPFTYSAEAFPLYIRELGMSYAVSVTWGFNFIVAFTFPRLLVALTPQGAFGYYAAWNVVGFLLVLFFLPETKALSLEELDQVFSVPTDKHAAFQFRSAIHWTRKNILRMPMGPAEILYPWEQREVEIARGFTEKPAVAARKL